MSGDYERDREKIKMYSFYHLSIQWFTVKSLGLSDIKTIGKDVIHF